MDDHQLVFRGLRGRTLDDQTRAIDAGYASVVEMAVDELGQKLLELTERVEQLEQAVPSTTAWRDRDVV